MFLEEISRCVEIIRPIMKLKKPIIISHYDADGLCSVSIITKMFLRENINFELKILKQLTAEFIESLKLDENSFLFFTDFGSGQLPLLNKILEKTQVFILDHHEPIKFEHMNLFHLNPMVFGEEGISSSVICYFFAKFMNIKNTDLIDLAIVGAIADEQDEKWEFKGLAKKNLEEAETLGKVTVFKGLRLYGRNTRPIFKALAYSFDPFIPEISGSESQAVQFLSDLGIKIKEDGELRKLKDLSFEEQQTLASAIIIERLKAKHSEADDIFGDVYLLTGKPEELQDAREFATLLNACGRTNNSEVAIRVCLGDSVMVAKSAEILENYKKMLGDNINWVRETKSAVLETEFANYILGGSKIPDSLIGTITSIVLNSNILNTSKPIFGFAETENGKIKVSARISRDFKKINLREVILNAVKKLDAEGGGHSKAAGALIPKEKKEEFMMLIDKILGEFVGKES